MLGYKFYNTIIVDTDRQTTENIIGMLEMGSCKRIGSKIKKLGKKQAPVIIVRLLFSAEDYRNTRRLIQKYYPETCMFDVKMV